MILLTILVKFALLTFCKNYITVSKTLFFVPILKSENATSKKLLHDY